MRFAKINNALPLFLIYFIALFFPMNASADVVFGKGYYQILHKFEGTPKDINTRDDVFVLVDEAYRTTTGDLGNYLMAALPNATYFGFTGTPIDKILYGKGTFKIFGKDDEKGYLDKYSIAESIVYPRKIVERALHNHATGVIIAHNHPGESLHPSADDYKVTEAVKEALKTVDVILMDHIIIGGNGYFSFKENGIEI